MQLSAPELRVKGDGVSSRDDDGPHHLLVFVHYFPHSIIV